MLSSKPGDVARIKAAGLVLAAVMAVTGCNAGLAAEGQKTGAPESVSAAASATVIRVIDGDTFTASVNGEEKTVRMLNVDTPETKDPNAPVECLGPEATRNLELLLPAGSTVRLELDEEPLDKYGRTLAGVFDSSGNLVNAEIARQGLGVPVLFEPNKKFYPPVVEAFEEAQARGVGLSSAEIPCLPAQQIEQAAKAVEAIVAVSLSDATSELDSSHAGLVTALAAVAALKTAANAKKHVHWAAYQPTKLASMKKRLDSATSAGSAHQVAIGAKKTALAEAEAAKAAETARQAAAAQAAETARQAAAAQAAAAAAAEAQRIRNLPRAPAPYVPPTYVPPAYVAPAAPAPAPNPYPGYNGPRCYAPGGKSWTPCSKK